MAEWSKVLSLTANYLSPMLEFKYRPGQVKKLPVTCGLSCCFSRIFFHHIKLASQD